MFLSRIELDTSRRSTMKALSAPQMLHGAVENSFTGERRRRLWRSDSLNDRLYLLVLCEEQPDFSGLIRQFGVPDGQAEIKDYAPLLQRITAGSYWRFRLTANPTVSKSSGTNQQERGTVMAHSSPQYQKKWLLDRASKHGFSLEEDNFLVKSSRWLHFQKGMDKGRPLTLLSVTYEGILQVTDANLFREMMISGIGRGKAYGQGLLTVMHYE